MIIKSTIKNYALEFIDQVLEQKGLLRLDNVNQKFLYLIDDNFYKIYKKKLHSFIGKNTFITIPANENSKSFHSLPKVYQALIEKGLKKNDTLVTFGGGVLQDISGFVASTIYRGVKWIFFPTTLLAQADSCIGSKTSINFEKSKNLIGTFYPPDKIYIDISLLSTLSEAYFYSGVGEIIKTHLMTDEKRYQLLKKFLSSQNLKKSRDLRQMIKSALFIKKSYFEGDELDLGKRNLLNYGHTFGHALESASDFKVAHGQAVLVGIGLANLLSVKRGILDKKKYIEIEGLISKYYPCFNLNFLNPAEIVYFMKKDKKRTTGDLTAILLDDIGSIKKYDDIKKSEVKNIINEFKKRNKKIWSK